MRKAPLPRILRHPAFTESSGFDMANAGGRQMGDAPVAWALAFQCLESRRIPEAMRCRQKLESASLSDIVFDPTDMDGMLARLEELRTRHRELDRTIEELETAGGDDIKVMGLKREKLRVKDRIVWLSSKIMPDIIA